LETGTVPIQQLAIQGPETPEKGFEGKASVSVAYRFRKNQKGTAHRMGYKKLK
jgi:hypothetical protein